MVITRTGLRARRHAVLAPTCCLLKGRLLICEPPTQSVKQVHTVFSFGLSGACFCAGHNAVYRSPTPSVPVLRVAPAVQPASQRRAHSDAGDAPKKAPPAAAPGAQRGDGATSQARTEPAPPKVRPAGEALSARWTAPLSSERQISSLCQPRSAGPTPS